MRNRFIRFIKKLTTIGITSFVIGTLVLINYAVSFSPIRIDLTENKIYSLSKATVDILRNLDKDTTITLYFSKDLPNRLLPTKREVESLLKEYERVGGRRLNLNIVTVDTNEKEREASSKGVPPLQFSGIEKDKLQVSKGFFGGVIKVASEEASIPVFKEGDNFEYQFTSAINRLSRKEIPSVAFATGHGESENLQFARELLSKDFDVRTQNLSIEKEEPIIPENIRTLIVVGSDKEWKKEEKAVLSKFAEGGGSVLFALNGVEVGQGLFASPIEHNLNDWFGEYGLSLNRDLVVSASNDIATFQTPQGAFIIEYPFWVRVRPEGFNRNIAQLSQLQTAVFPWASSVGKKQITNNKQQKANNKEQKEVEIFDLIKTVPQSYALEKNFNLSPDQDFARLKSGNTEEKVLAAAAKLKGNGRIVLIGDADFLQDNFLQRSRENAVLFLNLVDWLAGEGNLSSIRARQSSYRPLVELSEPAKQAVKYGTVLVAPLLFAFLGLIKRYKG